MTKLRCMSASTEYFHGDIVLCDGSRKHVDGIALRSYSSLVAVYDGSVLYLLPRYDYSRTTTTHVNAFIDDYTALCRVGYAKMRKIAQADDGLYRYAKGYVDGSIVRTY